MSAAVTLTRRAALKTGGAMIVGFSLAGALAARAQAQDPRGAQAGPPDMERLDTWLAIHEDNTATLYMGYAELGQGCTTALPQIAAEELDLTLDQIASVQLDTNITPYQGGTYSSTAIARGGPQVRRAAAEARQALLLLAAAHLRAPPGALRVEAGVVSARSSGGNGGGGRVTYGELIGGRRFDLAVTGEAPVKNPADYRIVGAPAPRKDMRAKLDGTYPYMQHERLPGMLHGRIVRPRGQRAYGAGAQVLSVDEASIADIPGARLVRQNDFLAVVAPREWDAVRAAQRLSVTWEDAPNPLPETDALYDRMRRAEAQTAILEERGDPDAAFAGAAHVVSLEVETPYQVHGLFAPNCALADARESSVLVICSSQDIYATRRGVAGLLGMEQDQVRVQYREGSGTYGKSCYDDCAQAAALASRLAGAPVRMQFMRHDEHGWDTCGPAHIGAVRIGADADGRITAYSYDGWQHSWSLIETAQQLALGTDAAPWPPGPSRGVNPLVCGGMYDPPNARWTDHYLPVRDWLRAGWLRSPLDLSFCFASEQAVDDLAHRFGADPYEFRRRNITDARWAGVLDAVAEAADWTAPRETAPPNGETVRGRGIGLGTHLASWGGAVAEIEVNRRTGAVRILHVAAAIDAGLTVNPAIVESQIVGQIVQTVSRILYEEVRMGEGGVTTLDWASYPVARFADTPRITPIVVQRLDEPCSGAGEEAMAAACAAIANAFFDATGRRMTTFPFTPPRVLAALA